MRFIATVEARMTSSRLPGKVLMTVLEITMLERLLIRLKSITNLDDIVVATTINSEDDPIVEIANKLGVKHFRGSEHDVIQRVLGAARLVNADAIVEITADCPIIDPNIIEQMIETFKLNECDYLSNSHFREFPDGMDVQIIKFNSLQHSADREISVEDREHVSLYIRKHPEIYKHVHVAAPNHLRYPRLRLTLDEKSDLEFLAKIIIHLEPDNPLFSCSDIIDFLKLSDELLQAENESENC